MEFLKEERAYYYLIRPIVINTIKEYINLILNMAKKESNLVGENMIDDLKFIIERQTEIIRHAEKLTKRFLDIDLALLTAFSFLFVYALDVFNNPGKISMLISIIIFFVYSTLIFIYELSEKRTLGIEPSICSARGWKLNEFNTQLDKLVGIFKPESDDDKITFQQDFITQIRNLYNYQENYHKVAANHNKFTFSGVLILLFNLASSVMVNSSVNFIFLGILSIFSLTSIIIINYSGNLDWLIDTTINIVKISENIDWLSRIILWHSIGTFIIITLVFSLKYYKGLYGKEKLIEKTIPDDVNKEDFKKFIEQKIEEKFPNREKNKVTFSIPKKKKSKFNQTYLGWKIDFKYRKEENKEGPIKDGNKTPDI